MQINYMLNDLYFLHLDHTLATTQRYVEIFLQIMRIYRVFRLCKSVPDEPSTLPCFD